MMMLFCILHFCIVGQTDTSFFAVEMERIMCEKNINDGVEASTRESQARFQIFQVSCSTEFEFNELVHLLC